MDATSSTRFVMGWTVGIALGPRTEKHDNVTDVTPVCLGLRLKRSVECAGSESLLLNDVLLDDGVLPPGEMISMHEHRQSQP